MSRRQALARFGAIITRLRRAPATFVQIQEAVARNDVWDAAAQPLSARTFQRDVADILSLYGILIEYDFGRRLWAITADAGEEASTRALEAFDTLQALNLSSNLSRFLLFERRAPRGTEHFHGLLHAMQAHQLVRFHHHSYWKSAESIRTVAPYALKEFRGRWYLVATDAGAGQIKTFGLDRISELEILSKRFIPQPFNAEDHFRHSFGIFVPEDEEPQEILLSFSMVQGRYVKSYPLHSSQRVVSEDEEEDEVRIRLQLLITYDFVMELLSYGGEVEVLAPERLKDEVARRHRESM